MSSESNAGKHSAAYSFPHFCLAVAIGVALFLGAASLSYPESIEPRLPQWVAGITGFMATCWLTGAISIGAASLLPLAAFPLVGVMPIAKVAVAYTHPLIWMFFGGFVIASGIERWGLHRRMALTIIHWLGVQPRRLVFGFMIATAFLSMWLNNTSTTLLMLPIAAAVVTSMRQNTVMQARELDNFALLVFLGVAYAASIGGLATPIGTAPNAVFLSNYVNFVKAGAPPLTFLTWLAIGLTTVVVLLPLTAWIMLRLAPVPHLSPEKEKAVLAATPRNHVPLSAGQWRMLGLFALVALLWITRADADLGSGLVIRGWWRFLPVKAAEDVGDAGVAMFVLMLGFMIPSGEKPRETVLNWDMVQNLPWDILFLLAGGMCVADAFSASGLSHAVGASLKPLLSGMHPWLMITVLCLIITLLSEFASNVAIAALFLPILASTAVAANIDPRLLMLPATFAASCGFMLPIATPPNAIAFATGQVPVGRMVRIGFVIDLVAVLVISAVMWWVAVPVLKIQLGVLPIWAK